MTFDDSNSSIKHTPGEGNTSCKAEQPLLGTELREKDSQNY